VDAVTPAAGLIVVGSRSYMRSLLLVVAIVVVPSVVAAQPSMEPPTPRPPPPPYVSPWTYGIQAGIHRTDESLEDTYDRDGASNGPMIEGFGGIKLTPALVLAAVVRVQRYDNEVTRGQMPVDVYVLHRQDIYVGLRLQGYIRGRVFLGGDLGARVEGGLFGAVHAGVAVVRLGPVWLDVMIAAGVYMHSSNEGTWKSLSVGVRR
jgi:hypothetical protein